MGRLQQAAAVGIAIGVIAMPATAADDFEPLFNGRDLAGWWGLGTEDPRQWMALSPEMLAERKAASLDDIHAHWRVEEGVLVNDGHGLYLTTDRLFGDFELRLEYRTVAGADSGIYLRGLPQVQIWDTTEAGGKWSIGADKGSGGLWNNTAGRPGRDPFRHADRPFGEWNTVRIVMVGERVTVFLNDTRVVDHARLENYFDRNKPVPPLGPIQLQTHGGEIRWRNVVIREIEPDEANQILMRRVDRMVKSDGFSTIFNGIDLTGWQGDTDNFTVSDHAIMCRPGKGGTLFTEQAYDDFAVQLEIQLPPGGNNGLAIRYPGRGDPAYSGLCELQVLENTHPKYAGLDPRQYHGSVYGQAAAQRGYLRPPGVWNFQEVTVNGQHVQVELNGTLILDTDLSVIEDLMYETEKFAGRGRTHGHFGFAGHHDPVRFRNVRIKRMSAPSLPQ